MVIDNAGMRAITLDASCPTAEQLTELRQAAKDCYCGLGPACTHWSEMTPQGRVECSVDKRAVAEARWKNGTVG